TRLMITAATDHITTPIWCNCECQSLPLPLSQSCCDAISSAVWLIIDIDHMISTKQPADRECTFQRWRGDEAGELHREAVSSVGVSISLSQLCSQSPTLPPPP